MRSWFFTLTVHKIIGDLAPPELVGGASRDPPDCKLLHSRHSSSAKLLILKTVINK